MGGSVTETFGVIRRMERRVGRSHRVARGSSRLTKVSGNGVVIVVRVVGWSDGIMKGRDFVVIGRVGVVEDGIEGIDVTSPGRTVWRYECRGHTGRRL